MIDGNNIMATNTLGKQQYYFLLRKLGIRDLHAPTWREVLWLLYIFIIYLFLFSNISWDMISYIG